MHLVQDFAIIAARQCQEEIAHFEAAGSLWCTSSGDLVFLLFVFKSISPSHHHTTAIHCNPKPLMHMVKECNMITLRAGLGQHDL